METEMTETTELETARKHLSRIGIGLVAVLGPDDAVASLLGVAVGILQESYGPEKAAEWLDEIVREMKIEASEYAGHA